jgi:hypothetical protein
MPSITSKRKPAADACRRFRFVFADSPRKSVSAKRVAAVAEYVESWMDAGIIAACQAGGECLVTVEIGRPVPVAVAERFCRECPHYVRDTFSTASGKGRSSRNRS